MEHESFEIEVTSASNQLFDLGAAGDLSGLHPDIIIEFERGKLVERSATDTAGNPVFDATGIRRLRFLASLRERDKLSLRMTRVFCQLMDRLERAESEVRWLRDHRD